MKKDQRAGKTENDRADRNPTSKETAIRDGNNLTKSR